MSEPVDVRRIEFAEIELVRPLWEELLAHHGRVAPAAMPPVRAPEVSWPLRRAEYEEWLALPGSFALVAEAGRAPVGYCVVKVGPGDETWATDEHTAEVETLSVDPGWRGRGIGTLLMDRVDAELDAAGIRETFVAAVQGNEGAIRFYERRGLTRSLVYFYGRR